MKKTFLHVDMDAFFAAVEQRDHPELRGRPVVVGARPDQRGVVAAASYEAREYGIRSAMPSREAGARCPNAVFLPVNGERYREVSKQIFEILARFTPLLEPSSIDEAFLDVSGAHRLFGTGCEIAKRIKAEILDETGLTASVGVAPNKFLAKLGSELDKPDGLTVMPDMPDKIIAFLAPLPINRIWGVGKVTQQCLNTAGIHTIGQLQATPRERLAGLLGRTGAEHLSTLARGEDCRNIELDRQEKSMSREYTFPTDCSCRKTMENMLCEIAEDVGRRLRDFGGRAAVAHLKLRWRGFKTITRQKPFIQPSCDDFSLRDMALALFRAENLIKPVRLIGFGVSSLSTSGGFEQLALLDPENRGGKERLSRAVDSIRKKFGSKTIGRMEACKSGFGNIPDARIPDH